MRTEKDSFFPLFTNSDIHCDAGKSGVQFTDPSVEQQSDLLHASCLAYIRP
jgi:hypothetical protein